MYCIGAKVRFTRMLQKQEEKKNRRGEFPDDFDRDDEGKNGASYIHMLVLITRLRQVIQYNTSFVFRIKNCICYF